MILNCDIVIASDKAQFALPEVKRGVVAVQGGEFSDNASTIVIVFHSADKAHHSNPEACQNSRSPGEFEGSKSETND